MSAPENPSTGPSAPEEGAKPSQGDSESSSQLVAPTGSSTAASISVVPVGSGSATNRKLILNPPTVVAANAFTGGDSADKGDASKATSKVELPRATTVPVVSMIPGSNPSPLVLNTAQQNTQHIRIPSVPANLRTVPAVTGSSSTLRTIPVGTGPRAPGAITIARPGAASPEVPATFIGHHRLPMTPVMTPTASSVSSQLASRPALAVTTTTAKTPPLSLAVLQQPPEAAKLTVVHASSTPLDATSKGATLTVTSQAATTMRPLSAGVTLTTGFPVTIQPPGKVPGQVVSNTPIQLVPLSSSAQSNRAAAIGTSVANLRQISTTPKSLRTAENNPVRVTLVQSSATISKIGQQPGQVGQPVSGANIFKPVTITTQASGGGVRQLRPPAAHIATSQSLRLATPTGTRMAVIPGHPGAINPSQISVPLVNQQQPMARILTSGSSARLITVPSTLSTSVGGGVTIQKTIVTSSAQAGKTISLPHGAAPLVQPKNVGGTSPTGIPVARVVPQLSGANVTPNPQDTNLYITRPVVQQMQLSSDNSLIVTSFPPNDPNKGMATLTPIPIRTPQKQTYTRSDPNDGIHMSPSRPGILRRREGERDLMPENLSTTSIHVPSSMPGRPDSRDGAGSSSGSTTLSATSSPDGANLSGDELGPAQVIPSPRKKPRKQQHSNVREQGWNEGDDAFASNSSPRRKIVQPKEEISMPAYSYFKGRPPQMQLINSYRHTWKSRHNHFLRHSDVRPKEERKPTVNELANQTNIMQKVNGWKVYHLSAQIEDVMDIEMELSKKLSQLQKKLDKLPSRELSKDVANIQEVIKANLQRSKVIQDQVTESKTHLIELFDHKTKVQEILQRYKDKRATKKRDLKV